MEDAGLWSASHELFLTGEPPQEMWANDLRDAVLRCCKTQNVLGTPPGGDGGNKREKHELFFLTWKERWRDGGIRERKKKEGRRGSQGDVFRDQLSDSLLCRYRSVCLQEQIRLTKCTDVQSSHFLSSAKQTALTCVVTRRTAAV